VPEFIEAPDVAPVSTQIAIPEGCAAVRSPMTANVWQVAVERGQRVEAGQKLMVLEAMKMEVPIVAANDGIVEDLHCIKGGLVTAGQNWPRSGWTRDGGSFRTAVDSGSPRSTATAGRRRLP
jgi:urea carboxylase